MAISTGLIEKLRGLFGNWNDSDFDVQDEVERMYEFPVAFVKASNTTNTTFTYVPEANCQLVDVRFVPQANIAANGTNYASIAVTCNALSAVATDTQAANLNGVTEYIPRSLSVNSSSVNLAANTICNVTLTHAGAANAPATAGTIVLTFRHN